MFALGCRPVYNPTQSHDPGAGGSYAMSTAVTASAAQVLRDSPLPQLRGLDVAENDNEITLRGCVTSYHQKQMAQESLLPILGERRLRNLITVARPS